MNLLCIGGILLSLQLSWNWWLNFLVKAMGFGLCFAGLRELAELSRIQAHKDGADSDPDVPPSLGGVFLGRYVDSLLSREVKSAAQFQGMRLGTMKLLEKWALMGLAVSVLGTAAFGLMSAVWPPEVLKSAEDGASRTVYNAFGLGGKAELWCSCVFGVLTAWLALRLLTGAVRLMDQNDHHVFVRTAKDGTELKSKTMHYTLDPLETRRLSSSQFNLMLCVGVSVVCDLLNRVLPWEGAQTFFGFLGVLSKVTSYVFVIIMGINFNHVRVSTNKKYDSEGN